MTGLRIISEVQIVVPMARQFTKEDCVTTGITFHERPQSFVSIGVHSPAYRSLGAGRWFQRYFAPFACFAVK